MPCNIGLSSRYKTIKNLDKMNREALEGSMDVLPPSVEIGNEEQIMQEE